MPFNSTPAAIFIGVKPPANPGPNTLWLSESHAHMRVPAGRNERRPILGSFRGEGASQEMNPWFNPAMGRWEALLNMGGNIQKFTYAATPYGPWSQAVTLFGQGNGGVAGETKQASAYIEGTTVYITYIKGDGTNKIRMATLTMPTNPATPDALPVFTCVEAGDANVICNAATTQPANSHIILVDGIYQLRCDNNAPPSVSLYTNTAPPSQWVSNKFQVVAKDQSGARVLVTPNVQRFTPHYGRDFVVYEDGLWILYYHVAAAIDAWNQVVVRLTSTDYPIPYNWTPDAANPIVRPAHPVELDQIADFRAAQGPDGTWWAFWTASDNTGPFTFSIMTAPMQKPLMQWANGQWVPVLGSFDVMATPGYVSLDYQAGDMILANLDDATFNTTAAPRLATMPPAAGHARVKINAIAALGLNAVRLAPKLTTETIYDGNPILSLTSVGTTVTLAFRRPHGLSTSDVVTVTGCTPTAYNVNGVAVASVVDATTITYVAGSAPGANTVIGFLARGLLPGETAAYKCRLQGQWVRD